MSEPNAPAILRSLAPELRQVESQLRTWLGLPRQYPVPLATRQQLLSLADELRQQADGLASEQPLLIVMLVGGTGVGKSTLLNALAGKAVASASFQRPTTRDPVVYYHESVHAERLDAKLRQCRLVVHNQPSLIQKVIVDTPDLDSNDLVNRQRLRDVLPVADVVLYVGSQEKYHDKLGWDLFVNQKNRRGFAFVLNKWDRCQTPGAGRRPDEDWLADLKAAGFQSPLLFRTVAQSWVDHAPNPPPDLPPGEQFQDLQTWLHQGLTRLEIEAVKAKGVMQLLRQLQNVLASTEPPDLTAAVDSTRKTWDEVLQTEAKEYAEALLHTLEPYQAEVQTHFAARTQQHFRPSSFIACYMGLMTNLRQMGSSMRDRLGVLPRGGEVQTPSTWDLPAFLRECSRSTAERVLDGRTSSLGNRLLTVVDDRFPRDLLAQAIAQANRQDWRERYSQAMREALTEVEELAVRPTGLRKLIRGGVIVLANGLPEVVFFGGLLLMLFNYFVDREYKFSFLDVVMPFIALTITLIIVQVLVQTLLTLSWPVIREDFRRQLTTKLTETLRGTFTDVPTVLAGTLKREREALQPLLADIQRLSGWLAEREQSTQVSGLFVQNR